MDAKGGGEGIWWAEVEQEENERKTFLKDKAFW